MEDGSVEVKIHDLPENVPEEKIVEFLCAFGEVIYIRELTWGEGYEFAAGIYCLQRAAAVWHLLFPKQEIADAKELCHRDEKKRD